MSPTRVKRTIQWAVILAVLLGSMLIMSTTSVKAGTNGQQLQIIGGVNTGRIFIML